MCRSAETKPGRCGSCKYFDTTTVDNESFGTVNLPNSARPLARGVCRATKGLALGLLNEGVTCRQPEGIFEPISDSV